MKDIPLKILTYPLPLRLALTRKDTKQLSLFSYEDHLNRRNRSPSLWLLYFRREIDEVAQQYEDYCIEFGCGRGNGFLNAETHITEVMKIFALDIELYGFDIGSGMSCLRDYRDIPHYFQGVVFVWIAGLWSGSSNEPSS